MITDEWSAQAFYFLSSSLPFSHFTKWTSRVIANKENCLVGLWFFLTDKINDCGSVYYFCIVHSTFSHTGTYFQRPHASPYMRIILHTSSQGSNHCYSKLQWQAVHTFCFYVWELLLDSYSLYLKVLEVVCSISNCSVLMKKGIDSLTVRHVFKNGSKISCTYLCVSMVSETMGTVILVALITHHT